MPLFPVYFNIYAVDVILDYDDRLRDELDRISRHSSHHRFQRPDPLEGWGRGGFIREDLGSGGQYRPSGLYGISILQTRSLPPSPAIAANSAGSSIAVDDVVYVVDSGSGLRRAASPFWALWNLNSPGQR